MLEFNIHFYFGPNLNNRNNLGESSPRLSSTDFKEGDYIKYSFGVGLLMFEKITESSKLSIGGYLCD